MSKKGYIPEYNPNKYKKAAQVAKVTSVTLLIIMILGVSIILLKAFTDDNSFVVNVNGVPRKDWGWMIICLAMIISPFGITSLCVFVLHIRLKQANAVFSEVDENKRLNKHLEFSKQAETARKVNGIVSTINVIDDINK